MPRGLTAAPRIGGLEVTWPRVRADDLAGYRLRWRGMGSRWSGPLELGPSQTSLRLSTLAEARPYEVALVAFDHTDNFSRRSLTGATTLATPEPEPDTTPPATPTALAATGGAGSVSATWDEVLAPDLAGYLLEHAESPAGPWVSSNLLATPSAEVTGLSDATTYYLRVAAQDGATNTSTFSQPFAVTTLPPA